MRSFLFLLGFGLIFLSPSALSKPETIKVNAKTSTLQWHGKKVLVSKAHTGKVKVKSGSVTFDKGAPTKANILVDMASITDEDISNAEWNQKLVGHLKSDDFFGVAKHPTANLKIKSFKRVKKGHYKANGDLTIKGITKPINFAASTSVKGDKLVVTADLTFDRSLFNVRYGSGKFFENLGDKMIADDIKIEAKILLKKPSQELASN